MLKKLFICTLLLCFATGCFPTNATVTVRSAQDVANDIKAKSTMILVVSDENCTSCKEFAEVTQKFNEEYGVSIVQVNINEEEEILDETTQEKVRPSIEELEQQIGSVGATPSVYFIQDGSVKSMFTGAIEYDNFVEKAKKNGFIPQT